MTTAADPMAATPRGLARWVVYQRERFPLLGHGPLIAAFTTAAVCLSALTRGADGLPSARSLGVAFVSGLLFFFQLRVSDEFKDAEDDARYRPYRAVPRGLVTLGELRALAIAGAVVQLVLALWLDPRMVWLLLLVWGYMGLMTVEFFVGPWLKRHPFTTLWSHMLIMPIIDLYATACDWVPAGAGMAPALRWFLVASFCNGVVIEIGRKIRAPEEEEHGVDTYTAVWGRPRAVGAWLLAMLLTAVSAVIVARSIGVTAPVSALLGALLLAAFWVAARFLRNPTAAHARPVQPLAGAWTLLMYVSVGIVPLLVAR